MRWLIVVALLAQEPVKFETKVAAGDSMKISIQSSLEVEILVKDGVGETTKTFIVVRKDALRQEVTGVSNGLPESLKIKCDSSVIQESGTALQLSERATEMAGKTFLVSRAASGWSVKCLDGSAPPAEARALGAWNELVKLLPKDGARQGDSWKIPAREISALIQASSAAEPGGTIDCTCESVADNKIALGFKGTIDCKGPQDSTITLKIENGRAVFDAGKGRPLSVSLTAALESARDVAVNVPKLGQLQDEKQKVGEIHTRSKKLEVNFTFE